MLSFVQFENNWKEAGLADVEKEDDIVPTKEQQRKDIEAGVDWHNVGIGSLFTEKLHLMADQGEDTGASANSFGGSKGGVLTVKSLSGMESDNERLGVEQQKNVEDSISATFRVLSACVRYGSPETKLGFLKRFSQLSMQQDVLKLAGYAFIFSPTSQSSATAGVKETDVALRSVTMWNAVLHAMDEEHMITVEQLPLLETLAALLPRLLDPLAVKMGSLLDLWRRTGKRDGFSAANQELLNKTMLSTEPPSYTKMLSALHGVSGLYSRMLRRSTSRSSIWSRRSSLSAACSPSRMPTARGCANTPSTTAYPMAAGTATATPTSTAATGASRAARQLRRWPREPRARLCSPSSPLSSSMWCCASRRDGTRGGAASAGRTLIS